MNYNYYKAVKEDVLEYIRYNIDLNDWRGDKDGLEEYLNDELWAVDSVTGNASGSYTCSSLKAAEYLCYNWELLYEVMNEYGYDDPIGNGPEWCDVSIRCYVLSSAISEVLEELEDELEELEDADCSDVA